MECTRRVRLRSERAHCAVRLHGAGAATRSLRGGPDRPGRRRPRDRERRTPAVPASVAAARHGGAVGAGSSMTRDFDVVQLAPHVTGPGLTGGKSPPKPARTNFPKDFGKNG